MLVVSCMNACWETVPTGRFQHPGCLRYPLTPAAAVALQGTPVKLSQGCGGVEGTNTLKHKENTHKHPHIHTLTHTHKKGSNSSRPHYTDYRARILGSAPIVSTTYHSAFQHQVDLNLHLLQHTHTHACIFFGQKS